MDFKMFIEVKNGEDGNIMSFNIYGNNIISTFNILKPNMENFKIFIKQVLNGSDTKFYHMDKDNNLIFSMVYYEGVIEFYSFFLQNTVSYLMLKVNDDINFEFLNFLRRLPYILSTEINIKEKEDLSASFGCVS